jgi:hypothetical protein
LRNAVPAHSGWLDWWIEVVQGKNSVSYIGQFEEVGSVGAMEGRRVEKDCPDPVVVTSSRTVLLRASLMEDIN